MAGVHYVHRLDHNVPAHTKRSEIASWSRTASDVGIATLDGQLAASGVSLVSDELLSLLPPPQARRLLGALAAGGHGGLDAVFVFRRWSARLPSTWAQRVRDGASLGFEAWMAETRRRGAQPYGDALMWSRWANWLSAAGGRRSIHIIPYDAVIAAGQDLFALFLQGVCGLDAAQSAALPPGPNKNESPTEMALEILRALNLTAQQAGVKLSLGQRTRFLNGLARRGHQPYAQLLPPYAREIHLDDASEDFAALRDAIAPWQDRVMAIAAGHAPPPMLLPGTRRVQVFDPAWISLPRAQAALSRSLANLQAAAARRLAAKARA